VRNGKGQLVFLSGEPGIGKTRLLEWLRDEISGDATWLDGRCASYGGQPLYQPLAEALHDWVGVDDVARRSATLERLGLEPDALPYLATLLSAEAVPEHGSNGASDEFVAALARAYASWIAGICREGPVVLALHDIHWADHGTLDVLGSLLALLVDRPLMIAATTRATSDGRDREFRERAQRGHSDRVVNLVLGPLSDDEAEDLLAQLTPGELEPDAKRELIALAEGNPLYLEHLLRSLLESGGLSPRRTWALTVSAAQLPTALESLLIARIAALPRDARRVAQVGAVLGRAFAPTVLAQVSGVGDVERRLMQLLRANVIRESRTVPNREYSFTHGLLQEAALSTLTRARRRELYQRVAAAHEQAFSDSLDDHLEQLAFYWARGGDLQRALEYLERAANRATSMHARTQAASLWSRAATLANRLDDPVARDRIERRLVELGA
jgi:predicted ATPase